ncbi:MAG: class I SAM-dependent DNA methyltransferase [Candidatus Kapabacteria bacterium]|nr:class I SAM-dependent DNA methyltransferase [Candidatus Kapabacteria bacterium]
MPLSWNEIKSRALTFSKEWQDETSEDAEAKSFLDGFFNVFGVSRRRIGSFEVKVSQTSGRGFIDMLWRGTLLIEMKSRGKNLDRAHTQAQGYFSGLTDADLPRYILVCDFERFRLYDLDAEGDSYIEFRLADLITNVQHFGFIAGYQKSEFREEDPVNIKAAELMGKLHDQLKDVGYTGHELELYLVRLLFCLFADDTTIFEKGIFYDYIHNSTRDDGSDLGAQLAQLFQVLNTPQPKRMTSLDESLAAFPYVNGLLFKEVLPIASFNSTMRSSLMEAAKLDWGQISPAIFGSLFQSVLDPQARRNLGAHYTSEKNILKVIQPLFMDELWQEFTAIGTNKNKLKAFHQKLATLSFLDPACGCGNFLIIAYRELRLLEIAVVKKLLGKQLVNVNEYMRVNVDQFYGIEYDEFPSQIAQVAMWLMDHQMNMLAGKEFGEYYIRIPLQKSATIVHGNALRIEWESIVPNVSYIFGNPPFVGHQWRNIEQMKDMEIVFQDSKKAGRLDYVTAWFMKAAKYMDESKVTFSAFVSTNSITQGEQTAILWQLLFTQYKIRIHFAHRTFSWSSEAKGKAAVHCVIVGFTNFDTNEKRIFEYESIKGEAHEIKVNHINAYLFEGKEIFILSRSKAIHSFPEMTKGSQPTDGTRLILTPAEKEHFEKEEPLSQKWILPFIGGEELLNNTIRYVLWLKNCPPDELKKMPLVLKRLEEVKVARLKSSTPSVRAFSKLPTLFTQDRQPSTNYLAMPRVSSENRKYIPISFLEPNIIAHEKLIIIPNATVCLFGILMSEMHNTWTRYVSGRLESRISYTPSVYNNFPWAENPTPKQIEKVEQCAQAVLDTRAKYPTSSLADLYDPLTMPPDLVKAHNDLDKAVDQCYRKEPFTSESQRIAYLFELYEKYTATLFTEQKPKKARKK